MKAAKDLRLVEHDKLAGKNLRDRGENSVACAPKDSFARRRRVPRPFAASACYILSLCLFKKASGPEKPLGSFSNFDDDGGRNVTHLRV